MMTHRRFLRRRVWRKNFFTALAVVLPACLTAFADDGVPKDDEAPMVEDLNFISGLRGPGGILAPYFAHKDLDADGIPDVFEAGLLNALLDEPLHPLRSAAKQGFQDCCDKLWKTNEGAAMIELFTFYMGNSAQGRDFAVWEMAVDQNVPENFRRPYALIEEYSIAAYGLITGSDDLDLDGKTNRQEFLEACAKFGLDGANFSTWTTANWGVAYVNNLNTTGNDDVMASFIAGTITPPSLPRTITGTVTWNGAGLGGVVINGLLGSPATDSMGFYSANTTNGWSGTATPSKPGFTFDPQARIYTSIAVDYSAQDFVAQQVTYDVTGRVTWNGKGLENVIFTGPLGDALSASDGSYTVPVPYDWSGNLSPMKDGFTFSPATKTYTNVTSAQSAQNYTATQLTRTISGHVEYLGAPLVDVTLQGLPGNIKTGSDGIYIGTVPYGWSGTVVPVLTGYVFDPPSISYVSVTDAQRQQNYVASLAQFTISGIILMNGMPVSGVTMQGLPGSPATGPGGFYNASLPYQWSGTVTPVKTGVTFDPPSRTYSGLAASQANQDFTATQIMRTIGGTVRSNGVGLPGVAFGGVAGAAPSDANGVYAITVPYGWSGTITPIKEGYTFNPYAHSYVNYI
ncbi:MAG TPA: hypothetical protein PKO36_17625, partial [Candidatus Hydrogenedentes bacterium]|nr:hypothetical protein [Candidatus Hydrogenedentota bacterium]